jgi:hypothetical protein
MTDSSDLRETDPHDFRKLRETIERGGAPRC